jgi:hypothetical protein
MPGPGTAFGPCGAPPRQAPAAGRDHDGLRVNPGVYFVRWQQRGQKAAARIAILE